MILTASESQFLTTLAREQNQTGCRGPAHNLLRKYVYPDVPHTGPGSLAFSYDAVPLTTMLVQDMTDLQAIDDFFRKGEISEEPIWPWSSPEEYRVRLAEAQLAWRMRKESTPSHQPGGVAEVDYSAMRVIE